MRQGPRTGVTRPRGVTLVEVMIVVAILAMTTGLVLFGSGMIASSRLKRSAVLVAGAVRIAYAHANAIGKPVRLVFDFEQRLVSIEESASPMLLVKGDRTGGAAAATEAERLAQEEAEKIVKGPRVPRPEFKPSRAFGFDPDAERPGKELPKGIRFLQIETDHEEEPVRRERVYLYFWPGGQTQRAAIQLTKAAPDDDTDDDADILTIVVSPLTGKAEIRKGKAAMLRPRDESEESEREDTGF